MPIPTSSRSQQLMDITDYFAKQLKEQAAQNHGCTCRDDQKQRAICPVCDKEEYEKCVEQSKNDLRS